MGTAACLITCLVMLLLEGLAYAQDKEEAALERVYIDVTQVNVRTGPGAEYSTVAVLTAGQRLDVIAPEGTWLKVKLQDGRTGYVSRRSVTSTPPAPVIVKNLQQKLTSVQEENQQLQSEINRLSDSRQDLELENSQLKTQVELLTVRNEELKSWRTVLWVILGLAVLLVGWGLGFLTGVFRRQAEDKRYERLIRDAGNKAL